MSDTPRPQRPAVLVFTQTTLMLQAFTALFATLVVYGLDRAGEVAVPQGVLWAGGASVVLGLAYAASAQRRRFGRVLGWIMQAPMLAAGFLEVGIAVIGAIFLMLWIMAIRLGERIDRERAERDAAAEQA